jgi:hydroxymethylbilane synthase
VDTLAGVVPKQTRALVCASRASLLAMTQTKTIMAALAQAGIPSTLLEITTRGDTVQDRSIAAIGTDNVFVKELEYALRDERADYAVHSCKDLPSALSADMQLAAITRREDARDAYCSERYPTFAALPPGARVGTSSPRRRAQLRALRPDLVYDDVRGNVDTRLRKLAAGQVDALVLAMAGLRRLGLLDCHATPLCPSQLMPAPGQGVLAVECRTDDPVTAARLAPLDHPPSRAAAIAERGFLAALGAGCSVPAGALAELAAGVTGEPEVRLSGVIAAADGSTVIRGRLAGAAGDGEALGRRLAQTLLQEGGAKLLDRC